MIAFKLVTTWIDEQEEKHFQSIASANPISNVDYVVGQMAEPVVAGTPLFLVDSEEMLNMYQPMNYLICEYSVDDLYPVQSVRLDTLYDTYAWMTPEKLMAAWEALISEPVIDTIVFGLRETIDVRENAPGTVLVKRCKPIRLVTREEDGP